MARLTTIARKAVQSLWGVAPLLFMAACSHMGMHSAPDVNADEVVIIGHRGAAGRAPENTIPSIDKALELEADAIEVDLRQTADGTVVALHDEDVDRTTDGSGDVDEMTLAEVRSLDAGSWFGPEFEGTRIPTLTEVLDAVPESTTLILEVKGGHDTHPGQIPRIVESLHERERDNVVLKSFAVEDLEVFEELAPTHPRLYVFAADLAWLPVIVDDGVRIGSAFDQDVQWLQQHRLFTSGAFIETAHEKGFRVVIWDVHDQDDLVRAVELGADAIETDYPGRLHRILEGWPPGSAPAHP